MQPLPEMEEELLLGNRGHGNRQLINKLKNETMKEKLLFLTFGLMFLFAGCSSDEESLTDSEKGIKTIAINNGSATRVSYDGNDVLWKQGDAVGMAQILDENGFPERDPYRYYSYDLIKGAGTQTGVFSSRYPEIWTMKKGTWVAFYPEDHGRWVFELSVPTTSFIQKDDTPNHLADKDLMMSEEFLVTDEIIDGSAIPTFNMKHLFAMVQFDIKNGNKYYVPELSSIIMESASGERCFAGSFLQKRDFNRILNYDATSVCVGVEYPVALDVNEYKSFWLLAVQNRKCDLNIKVIFKYKGVDYTVWAPYSPTSILEGGKKYTKKLILNVNDERPNLSEIVIEN